MRIAIDARKLRDFGIGTYVRNVLRVLGRIDRENEYILLCRPSDRDTVRAFGDNFEAVVETSGNYSVAEQIRVPLALRRAGAQVFHAPHYVMPPFLPCPAVVTIHDCIHLMFPEYLPNKFAHVYARHVAKGMNRQYALLGTAAAAGAAGYAAGGKESGMQYAGLDVDTDNPTGAPTVFAHLGYERTRGSAMYTIEI